MNPPSIPLGLYADRAQIVEQCLKPFGAEFQAPLLRELGEFNHQRPLVRRIWRRAYVARALDVAVVIVTPGDAKDVATVTSKLPKAAVTVVATGTESRSAVGLSSFLTMQHRGTFVLSATGRVLAQRTATMPTASFSRSEALAALAG